MSKLGITLYADTVEKRILQILKKQLKIDKF